MRQAIADYRPSNNNHGSPAPAAGPLPPSGKARARAINAMIAQRLRAARNMARLSQETAAAALGLTFQQLQKYEKGTNRISCGSLAVLADLYGVTAGYFFEGTGEGAVPQDDFAAQLLALPYGADLARGYARLANAERRAVVEIVRQLAGQGDAS